MHLSSIYRAIAIENKILDEEEEAVLALSDVRDIVDPVARLRMNIGLAWESHYVQHHLPEVVGQPGELLCDGIYMTPDGECLDMVLEADGIWRYKLIEIKATYKSLNTVGFRHETYHSAVNPIGPLTSQWMWMAQTKGYCRGAGTRYVDLHVLFLCGDYSRPIRPCLVRYQIEFTDQEIDDNWRLMTEYRDYRLLLESNP